MADGERVAKGWSWSLHFAQEANVARMLTLPSLKGRSQMTDRGAPLILQRPGDGGFYVYVDNLGFVGCSRKDASSFLAEATTSFGGAGLDLHESQVHADRVEILGVCIDTENRMTYNTAKRIKKLWNALGELEKRRTLGGWELEVVMGHITHFCMVKRELLSIFHCVPILLPISS